MSAGNPYFCTRWVFQHTRMSVRLLQLSSSKLFIFHYVQHDESVVKVIGSSRPTYAYLMYTYKLDCLLAVS
ncbi:hypothetical protein DFA_05310 [Cavenderia fasciculata]|uniref:Uncharacterized protein n=1 Tax=Cavenderia fasciculata TaxID=261658 RepID=F4PNX5_CACFS|nr:uncharacterized protein DFA_05310 [Cavenderia fasciculata]EGG23178.1 hypothetical protein DFA_05310 [Cavenderia fasciculata]|eukprot:XP_004361029.1 hypothetical protein DFA_05310 [Cavenderia fasciculata]